MRETFVPSEWGDYLSGRFEKEQGISGWTPYFPLLGGVVTEIGGLLSHGAVVAREYGLPAIVGLPGVTEFVKSGDIVTLDGDKGLLLRYVPGENSPPSATKTEINA